jgi:hypothetical protein
VLALWVSYPTSIHSLPQLTHYTDASGTDLFGEGLWEQRAHYTARRAEIREALAPYVAPEAYALDEANEGKGGAENQMGKLFPPEIGYKKPTLPSAKQAEAYQEDEGDEEEVEEGESIGGKTFPTNDSPCTVGIVCYAFDSKSRQGYGEVAGEFSGTKKEPLHCGTDAMKTIVEPMVPLFPSAKHQPMRQGIGMP